MKSCPNSGDFQSDIYLLDGTDQAVITSNLEIFKTLSEDVTRVGGVFYVPEPSFTGTAIVNVSNMFGHQIEEYQLSKGVTIITMK